MVFLLTLKPLRPNNFLTTKVSNELSHFDIFLHVDVLEIFNFNYTKVITILPSMYEINCEEY